MTYYAILINVIKRYAPRNDPDKKRTEFLLVATSDDLTDQFVTEQARSQFGNDVDVLVIYPKVITQSEYEHRAGNYR